MNEKVYLQKARKNRALKTRVDEEMYLKVKFEAVLKKLDDSDIVRNALDLYFSKKAA